MIPTVAKTPEEQFGVSLPEEPEPQLPAQISDPEPEENVAEAKDERPDWLPSKFKAPEDLARSYSELESKLGEQGKTIAELQAQMQQQEQYDPNMWGTDEDYLNELFESNPREAVALTVQQQLQEMQRQAWQQQQQYRQQNEVLENAQRATQAEVIADVTARHMEDKYEDWDQFQERAQSILQDKDIPQHELFDLPKFEQHVEEAYKLAKYEYLTGQEQELRSQGISQEEIDRLRKEQAQTLTARRSAPREQLEPNQQKALELLAARNQAGTPPWY